MPRFLTKDNENPDSEGVDKSYRVPSDYYISGILDFMYEKLEVKNYIQDTNRDNVAAHEHLALALALPEALSKQKYVILDNNVRVRDVYSYLYYLYDEEAQKYMREKPNGNPTIKFTYMKKTDLKRKDSAAQ